jgi:hypothetical protein
MLRVMHFDIMETCDLLLFLVCFVLVLGNGFLHYNIVEYMRHA